MACPQGDGLTDTDFAAYGEVWNSTLNGTVLLALFVSELFSSRN